MMIVFFVVMLLCCGTIGATEDCSTCSKPKAVTCMGTDNNITTCQESCGSEETLVFSLTADVIDFYPYVGDNVSLAVNLTASETTTVDINVTLVANGTEAPAEKNEKGEYVYVVKNVPKESEGNAIVFKAVGTMGTTTVCATITLSIKYVSTVSVRLDETNYVFTHCESPTCSELIIPVTVSANVDDWNWIQVYDTGPSSTTPQRLDPPVAAAPPQVVYDYRLPTTTKLSSSGDYTFYAEEHSGGESYRSPSVTASVYVHSTILTPVHTSYYVEEGDNVTLTVTLNTELESWDNVKLQVQLPNDDLADISLESFDIASVPVNIMYPVTNINLLTDAGQYRFIATEITEKHGNTTDTANVTVFSLSISSDAAIQDDKYIAPEGTKTDFSCSVFGADAEATWFDSESATPVSNNTTLAVFQSVGVVGEKILVFSDTAGYSDSGLYTCNMTFDGDMRSKNVDVVVQGLKDIEYIRDGNRFECRASGNPKPTISWTINDKEVTASPSVQITMSDVDTYTVESNVTVKGDTLCLGKDEITCSASNGVESREGHTRSMSVNADDVYIYQNLYTMFVKEAKSYGDALSDCTDRGGSLSKLEDDKMKNETLSFAKESDITMLYAGAKKDGDWKWSDGSNASSLNLGSDALDCATFEFNDEDSTWSVGSTDCSESLAYSCQIIASSYPQDLELASPPCDGDQITATWQLTGDEPASVTVDLITIDNTEQPESVELDSTATSTVFTSKEEAEYLVKVSTKSEDYCTANPYIEETVTTGYEDSAPPDVVSMTTVNTTSCKVEWEYENGNGAEVREFYVELTEKIKAGETVTADSKTKSYALSPDARKFEFLTKPNSVYTAKVRALSDCGKNSTGVESVGTCTTDTAAPTEVDIPAWHADQSASGVTIAIPPVDERNGAVSCQFVVVRYVRPDVAHTPPDIDAAKFENIKDASVNDVNIGEDYFAYATKRLSSPYTLVLGDGMQSDCVPLPASGSRKKRELAGGDDIKALNRGIKYGMQMQYYMVTTTASEDGKSTYFANSNYSPTYIVDKREPKGPNAAAIVLSILAVLFVLIIGVFCYRRWRSRRKSLSESSNRTFRFSNDVHYDVL